MRRTPRQLSERNIKHEKNKQTLYFPMSLQICYFVLEKISGDANKHPRIRPEKTKHRKEINYEKTYTPADSDPSPVDPDR